MESCPHIPVLLEPVLDTLLQGQSGVYVDGTFGAGGYTRAILNANPDNHVIGFDRDPNAVKTAETFEHDFSPRFRFYPQTYLTSAKKIPELISAYRENKKLILDVLRNAAAQCDYWAGMTLTDTGWRAMGVVSMREVTLCSPATLGV